MKIVHICLCGPVTDGWSYQENMISKFHVQLGHEVTIITSKWVWGTDGRMNLYHNTNYINENGVKMQRLAFMFGTNINSKIKLFSKVNTTIADEKPDIIFIHGCQFWDIRKVVKYLKKHPSVKVYVDNHADYTNSASNWLSRNILHKVIWRYCAHLIEPFTTKFYGVLPARVEFLKNIYKLPEEKVDLLVMGADDEKVVEAKNEIIRNTIRNKYNIKPNDFLIITGGKIDDAKKQTLLLMKAVKKIDREDIKLIVFGSVTEELKDELFNLCDNSKIQYIGWIQAKDSYNYFSAADLVVFPGRHSVFWEQVAGLGIPMVVKYWDATNHIDLGGNCRFLYKNSVEEITEVIYDLLNNPHIYKEMKKISSEKGIMVFSYLQIAKRSINAC
jgi:glycosyltransferase involved in cell wall biosynthesis